MLTCECNCDITTGSGRWHARNDQETTAPSGVCHRASPTHQSSVFTTWLTTLVEPAARVGGISGTLKGTYTHPLCNILRRMPNKSKLRTQHTCVTQHCMIRPPLTDLRCTACSISYVWRHSHRGLWDHCLRHTGRWKNLESPKQIVVTINRSDGW